MCKWMISLMPARQFALTITSGVTLNLKQLRLVSWGVRAKSIHAQRDAPAGFRGRFSTINNQPIETRGFTPLLIRAGTWRRAPRAPRRHSRGAGGASVLIGSSRPPQIRGFAKISALFVPPNPNEALMILSNLAARASLGT